MSGKKKVPSVDATSETVSTTQYSISADKRARNFATVVYPDSAPADWLDILAEAKIPVFVSPIHDKDKNPTGEEKKPHFHVLACYEGKKSIPQVREFFDTFGGVGCEVVQSLRGYARYLCHLDNPEKEQYSIDDVKSFGGADYVSTIGLPIDKYKSIREMMEWCDDNNCVSYAELITYARDDRFDWFRVLCDNGTVVMKEYLKSKQWTDRIRKFPESTKVLVVNEDGEYIDEWTEPGADPEK